MQAAEATADSSLREGIEVLGVGDNEKTTGREEEGDEDGTDVAAAKAEETKSEDAKGRPLWGNANYTFTTLWEERSLYLACCFKS